jgi:hypothetical protein
MNNKAFDSCRWLYQGALFAILLAAPVIQSQAQSYAMSTGGASMQINLTGSGAGISDWQFNNADQLNQQWYYFSVDGGQVYSISDLGLFSSSQTSIGNQTTVDAVYSNSVLGVEVTVNSTLGPTGTGQSTLNTTIALYNLTGSSHAYNLYQYSDFDIGGSSGDQTVNLTLNESLLFSNIKQTSSSTGQILTGRLSGVSGGTADALEDETGTFDGTDGSDQFGIYDGDHTSPTLDDNASTGPGNVDFAYEVNGTLGANSTTGLSFGELETVPEPSTIGLIFSGMAFFGLYYRNKLASIKKD